MSERESITYQERYVGAKITSVVMKVFGGLWLIAGIIVIARTDRTYSNTSISLPVVLAIEVASTFLGAASFAFMAYLLDLLRALWEESAGEND